MSRKQIIVVEGGVPRAYSSIYDCAKGEGISKNGIYSKMKGKGDCWVRDKHIFEIEVPETHREGHDGHIKENVSRANGMVSGYTRDDMSQDSDNW